MLRELQDAGRTLRCVQDKLDEYGQVFRYAQDACRENSSRAFGIDGEGNNLDLNFLDDSRPGHPFVLPKPAELASLLREREQLQERSDVLTKRLGLGGI